MREVVDIWGSGESRRGSGLRLAGWLVGTFPLLLLVSVDGDEGSSNMVGRKGKAGWPPWGMPVCRVLVSPENPRSCALTPGIWVGTLHTMQSAQLFVAMTMAHTSEGCDLVTVRSAFTRCIHPSRFIRQSQEPLRLLLGENE